ncbi:MAG: hypothetical protein KDC18_17645 [Alphaproteobacteria bacterium]|nr:hypothetical protein [Alphaproteobacteria bacterium]MCB9929664.1 hypothetical protein [Alphaproteobacteria bacterium]
MAAFPLLAIVVVLFNALAFFAPGLIEAPLVDAILPSGAGFLVRYADALVGLGLVLLFLEIAKATRTSGAAVVDHALSMVVFVVCLVELLLVKEVASAAFALLTLMTMIDVIAGFTVTIAGARRDFGVER